MKRAKWLAMLMVLCMALSWMPMMALAEEDAAEEGSVSYAAEESTAPAAQEAAPVKEAPAAKPTPEPVSGSAPETAGAEPERDAVPEETPEDEISEAEDAASADEPAGDAAAVKPTQAESPEEPSEKQLAAEEEALGSAEPVMAIDGDGEASAGTGWSALQDRLNTGGSIQLTEDVTAEDGDSRLVVPAGVVVNLDLNGYTIDRGLTEPVKDGDVLYVQGSLTVADTSSAGTGRITGGSSKGDGGGICVAGTIAATDSEADPSGGSFILEGGAITGNTARTGGGVYAEEGASVLLRGGKITGNTASDSGGGAGFGLSGFSISGSPVILENTLSDGTASNVYVSDPGKSRITVAGALTDDAQIGVTAHAAPASGAPITLTTGLSGNGTASCFASDNRSYVIGTNADGEAILAVPVTIRFDSGNGGSGAMESITAASGGQFVLPACDFTPSEGEEFDGWQIDGEKYAPGDSVTIGEGTSVTALWKTQESQQTEDPTETPTPQPTSSPSGSGSSSGTSRSGGSSRSGSSSRPGGSSRSGSSRSGSSSRFGGSSRSAGSSLGSGGGNRISAAGDDASGEADTLSENASSQEPALSAESASAAAENPSDEMPPVEEETTAQADADAVEAAPAEAESEAEESGESEGGLSAAAIAAIAGIALAAILAGILIKRRKDREHEHASAEQDS